MRDTRRFPDNSRFGRFISRLPPKNTRLSGYGNFRQTSELSSVFRAEPAPGAGGIEEFPVIFPVHGNLSPLRPAPRFRLFPAGRYPAATQSTTRSPIMITVAWAPPDRGMRGITDASATNNPWMPLTLQYWSTTAIGSESGPILQVPDTCLAVPTVWRIQRSKASLLARMSSVG